MQQVTSSPRQEFGAMWSPDGTALAFSEISPSGATWIARRSAEGTWTSPVQRLSRGFWPTWSPDGRWLAFSNNRIGGSIEMVPVDSGSPRVVLDASLPATPAAEEVRWSADSRSIYFKSHDASGNAFIWSVPAPGGTPRLLVQFDDPARPSYRNTWSLGRDHIYFTIEDRQSDIWVMEVAPR